MIGSGANNTNNRNVNGALLLLWINVLYCFFFGYWNWNKWTVALYLWPRDIFLTWMCIARQQRTLPSRMRNIMTLTFHSHVLWNGNKLQSNQMASPHTIPECAAYKRGCSFVWYYAYAISLQISSHFEPMHWLFTKRSAFLNDLFIWLAFSVQDCF